MHRVFKCAAQLLLGCAAVCTAQAADTLPVELTGNWQTAVWVVAGTSRQIHLQLDANGFGVLVGTNDAAAGTQAMIASPLQAVWDGETLTAHVKPAAGATAVEMAQATRMTLTCYYRASGVAVVCHDSNGVLIDLRRLTGPLRDDIEAVIAKVRARQ